MTFMIVRNVKGFRARCIEVLETLQDQLAYEESEDYYTQDETREQINLVTYYLAACEGKSAIEVEEAFLQFLRDN